MQMNDHVKEFERTKSELERARRDEENARRESERARRDEETAKTALERAKEEEEKAKKEQGEWEKGQRAIKEERDQLRLANAQFNNQYLEQSKELGQLGARKPPGAEVRRLRQHLVSVEETYTQEVVKGGRRDHAEEALAKMEGDGGRRSQVGGTCSEVEEWIEEIKRLADIAKHGTPAYTAFTFGIKHKWKFLMRTVPNIGHLLQPIEDTIKRDLYCPHQLSDAAH
ncbi:caldesmon-like, partial [Penaeus japonicus]|uniref:caldesmon-like n=1 Tax=Penaeus japonicus TaxID=27405 RepID=UPI001C70EE19